MTATAPTKRDAGDKLVSVRSPSEFLEHTETSTGIATPASSRPQKRRWHVGTAGRLAWFHVGVLAVVLGVVTVALIQQFTSSYQRLATNNLVAEMRDFESAAGQTQSQDLLTFAHTYLEHHSLPSGVVLVIHSSHGILGSPGAARDLRDPHLVQQIANPPVATTVFSDTLQNRSVAVMVAPILSRGHVLGSFVAIADLTSLQVQRSRAIRLSLAEAGIALTAGALSAYFLLRRQLRIVGRITTTAQEIERGQLDRRLGDPGTADEVAELATTFDAMIDRLGAAMENQRQLLSDVSHQLRTPLTVAQGQLEVLQRTDIEDPAAVDQTLTIVLEELDEMRAMVEQLLLLGRSVEPGFVIEQPVALRAFMGDLLAASQVLADRSWNLEPVPDLVLSVDEAKLRGAMLNLIDNAIKATIPGDSILLRVTRDVAGGIVLSVDDSGPGIPVDQRTRVMERFTRLDPNRPGSGLGLAIVRAVAEAHGGRVDVGSSEMGGAAVSIVLPPRVLLGSSLALTT